MALWKIPESLIICNSFLITNYEFLYFAKTNHNGIMKKSTCYLDSPLWQYGLWRFQRGGTKLERFLPKNQHTQGKLLDFENWVNETRSKRAKIWLSKSVFYLKNHSNLSKFFVIEDCHNEGEIWCLCTPLTKRVQNCRPVYCLQHYGL